MIGQHLILRCKRGCFETAGAAGFKSAGISENLRNQPNIKTLESRNSESINLVGQADHWYNVAGSSKSRGFKNLSIQRNDICFPKLSSKRSLYQ